MYCHFIKNYHYPGKQGIKQYILKVSYSFQIALFFVTSHPKSVAQNKNNSYLIKIWHWMIFTWDCRPGDFAGKEGITVFYYPVLTI